MTELPEESSDLVVLAETLEHLPSGERHQRGKFATKNACTFGRSRCRFRGSIM